MFDLPRGSGLHKDIERPQTVGHRGVVGTEKQHLPSGIWIGGCSPGQRKLGGPASMPVPGVSCCVQCWGVGGGQAVDAVGMVGLGREQPTKSQSQHMWTDASAEPAFPLLIYL